MSKIDRHWKTKASTRRRAPKAPASTVSVLWAALAFGVASPLSGLVFASPEPQDAPAPPAAPAPAPETPPAAPAPAPETPPAEPAPAPPTPEEKAAALRQIGVTTAEQVPVPSENPAAAAQMVVDVKEALANPTPPAPAPSEPIKVDYDPERSYSRLLYPSVAARVGLTDAQTARVNELMTERAQKLAQGDKSQWNDITAASEEALKAVLTAEQIERFERGVSEKTITMRFNKERWEDVLKWFASEVGLQLIMSAPPQGTFTYNDKTPYSPKDALDVVNGYLNFKGYTLFRYNEMLILHDFRTGSLPLQYMPKITPEDLPNQNRFDYVALTIPLERRSMNAVRLTIAPFQGPHCFLRSQGGNSLLVVDSVNALREIYAAAMSVHNPDPPPPPPQTPRDPGRAPEAPEWREFPLEGVAYNTVKAQIDVFAPEAKSLYNPQSNVLHYLARPSQLNIIEGLIARLQQGADPAKNAIAKVYPLDRLAAASASDIWAFSRRMRGGAFGAPSQSTLYTQIVDALQQMAPDAQIELNAEARKIFVVGTAAEHEKIAATFASLTTEVAPEEAPVVKVYRFQNQRSSSSLDPAIMQALRTVAPFAQPTPTTDGGLLIVATQAEHEIVAKTLADFEASAEAPELQRELKVYRMTTRQVARFTQIYSQLSSSPDMRGATRVSDSTSPNRVVFWALPSQHAKIAKIIDEIVAAESYVETKAEPAPQGLPAAQDPAAPAPAPAAPAPAPAAPAEPTPEQKAAAEKAAQEAAAAKAAAEKAAAEKAAADKAAAEKAAADKAAAEKAAAEKAAAEKAAAEKAAAEAAAKKAAEEKAAADKAAAEKAAAEKAAAEKAAAEKAAQEAAAKAAAAKADAEKAAKAAEEARRFAVGDSGAYMTVLPTKKVSVYTAQSLLLANVPGVDVTIDSTTPSLIIYGSKTNVEAAIELVNRLENNLDVVLEIVDVKKDLPAEVVTAFPRLEPHVTATYDRTNKRFLLYGRPADVARLKAYIAQIQTATTDEVDGVYYLDVERDVPGELQDYARKAVPGAEITYDSSSRRFTIIGTPTEQLAATKILVDAVANLPAEDETRYYRFDEQIPDRMIDMLRERVKGIKEVARDDNNSAVLRVVAKPFQHEEFAAAIEKVKAEYPFADENTFVSYPVTDEVRARFDQVRDDFVKRHGSIRILNDADIEVMSVWALPSQHAALKKLLGELGSLEEPVKPTAALYRPKHVDAATLVSLLKDLHKDVTVTNDTVNRRLTMRGKPADLEEAKATLAAIDVKNEDGLVRTYKSYPIKGFYNYDGVGNYYSPTYYLRELSALVPAAKVTYDYYNQALVVWGTEEEHALIQEAVSNLMKKDGLDNRMSRWQVRRAAYSTLLSSIRSTVPGATVTYESASKSIIITAKNKETLDEVRELLELLDPEEVSDFDPILSYYDVGANPTDDLVDALEELVPNAARIEIDAKNKQLLVIAKPAEHKIIAANVAQLAKTYGSSDKRMIPYPVYGMEIDALVDSLTEAYPTATVEADERGSRVIVRATLDDHVKISEEIEQINASEVDADNPDAAFVPGPRVSVYTVKTPQVATQLRGVVAQLFPSAEVFAGNAYGGWGGGAPSEQKIVVLANGREQKMIANIVEELAAPGKDAKLEFAVYPFGNVAPETVESLVENLIPTAVYVPAPVGAAATAGFRMSRQNRMPWMRRGGANGEAQPFYRVDPTDKTLALFANAEDHEAVKDAVGKLATLAVDDAKVTSKVQRLEHPLAYSLLPAFAQVFPALTATPTSGYEIIIYGPEAELAKTDAFFEGLKERAGSMKVITLPPDSRCQRVDVLPLLRMNFSSNGLIFTPGAKSDQLLVWGPGSLHETVEKFVAEICQTSNEATYKTLPVVHTAVPSAVAFLAKVCPNVEITPDAVKRQLVVYGSPLQLEAVEKALKAFDVPTDASVERVVRGYTWPYAGSFWKTYSEVAATFPAPQAIISQSADYSEIIITASEEVQAKVAAYVEARLAEASKKAPSLKAYYLTRVNFTKLVQIVPTVVPGVAIYPGKGSNEVFVVATEINHEKFLETLTRLETIPEGADVDGIEPKIYQVSPQGATAAIGLLTPQIPGAVMYPLSGSRLVVWGSVSDHERVAKALEVVGEAFPNVTLKKYPIVHLRYADVIGFMTTRFPTNEAYFYPSSDGSLMCQAPEVVQAQVVELLKSLDVEDGPESRFVPRAYDISDIPVASHVTVSQALVRIAPEAIQLPTSTPGFLVVSARPSVHKKIEEHLAELLKERPNANKTLVAYSLRRMTLQQLSALILPLYPNVKLGVGTTPNQVVVLAKADEHEKIASIIEQLENSTDGQSTVIYKLQYAVPATARLAILAVYPTATIVADPLAGSLTVKTYPDEQAKIAEMIEALDGEFTTEVYRLQYATPAVARASVLAVFPTATVIPDVLAKTLTVKTRPEDQPKIAEFVKEIDNTEDGLETQVYRLKYAIPSTARAAIIAAYPTATIIANPPSAALLTSSVARTLTVKTVPGDQPKIAAMIETLDVGDDGTTARVYRVKNSQQNAVQLAILQMYPQAVITLDPQSRSLLVKAYESDHEKIAQLVTEMDERDPERNTTFKIFNVGSLDFNRLLRPLNNFYGNDVAFRAYFDDAQKNLIVRGTADQHATVAQLIEEARNGGLADPESYMQSYTIKNRSVITSLYSIFYEQGRDVNMYQDYTTGKLIVVGRPEDHKMVLDVLDVLEPAEDETQLAIFDLTYVDSTTATQAFAMIETEGAYHDVRYDGNTNRLFARSTPELLEKMRQMLIQMGEKGLEKMKPFVDPNNPSSSSSKERRVYLRERAEKAAADAAERIDLKNLKPIESADDAAQAVEPTPAPTVAPAKPVEAPKPAPAPAPAQPVETPKPAVEPSVKVEATPAGRVVTIQGADAAKVVGEAVKSWTRENQVKVLVGDGGIVQEKPAVAPAQPTPAPEAAPAKPVEPTAEEKAAAEKAAAEKAAAEKAAAEKAAAEKAAQEAAAKKAAEEKAAAEKAAAEKAAAEKAAQPAPVPAPAEAPKPAPAPEKPVETAPAQPAPATEAAPKTASVVSSLFFSASRALLKNAAFGALVVDGETVAEPENAPETETTSQSVPENAVATDVPGVYVVVNPDGTATLYSSDEEALDEFQRRLTAVVDEMKTTAQTETAPIQTGETTAVATENVDAAPVAAVKEKAEEDAPKIDDPADPSSLGYLSYMTPENREKARERILMESRNYTVYRVENVGVQQLLPRLQSYMADRVQNASPYYYYQSSGVSITNMQQSVQLSFQPDVALNTIAVYGSKADRDVAGAMIVHLDSVDLFPQPITKPHKIKVANTSPTRMAQQVLNAFSRKFQTTLMPGNQSPRIFPNVTTGNIEVYAPENLAKEIEEYVKEVDREILEENIRKVRVVELKSMNSTVLTQYLQNLRSRQTAATMLTTPYVGSTTPVMPRSNFGGGAMGRYPGMGGYGGYPGLTGGYGGYPGTSGVYPRGRGF